MILKVLQKAILMGGAGGAIYLSNSLDVSDSLVIKPHNLPKTSLPSQISSLDDIELYEKFHGCKFAFVNGWKKNETYNAKEFLEKNKDKVWKERVIEGANKNKAICENKKVVTLEFRQWRGGSGIVIKQ